MEFSLLLLWVLLTKNIILMTVQGQVEFYENSKGHQEVPVTVIPANVVSLHLEDNEINRVDWFPSYTNITSLHLSYNNLTEFPNLLNISLTLQVLYLNSNNISYIDYYYFGNLTALQKLYLKANCIYAWTIPDVPDPQLAVLDLDDNPMMGMIPNWQNVDTNLRYLTLRGNGIIAVSYKDFEGMYELSSLSLNNNNINQTGGFPPLLLLSTFILSNNFLTEFPDLRNLSGLQYLYLDSNSIPCIPGTILDRLVSLKVLHMRKNLLTTPCFPDVTGPSATLNKLQLNQNLLDTLPHLPKMGHNIHTMHLIGNYIASLTDSDLDSYPSINTLYINGNNISTFPLLERNGYKLQTLSLKHNKISYISLDHLRPLKHCTKLSIGGNFFSTLPNLCRADFVPTLTLDLDNAELNCDVQLFHMLASLDNASFSLVLGSAICSAPASLYGTPLSALQLHDALLEKKGNYDFSLYRAVPGKTACMRIIISEVNTRSRLECGVLCSVRADCLMYGYTSNPISLTGGLCAVTSLMGSPVQTNFTFSWFIRE